MGTVDIPWPMLAGIGTRHTDAMTRGAVSDTEVGLVEGEGCVDVSKVLVVTERLFPEMPLPLEDIVLADIKVWEVVDAQGTAHLGGIRGIDKNVVKMFQEVVRATVGEVDIGVGVDEEAIFKLLVDACKDKGAIAEVAIKVEYFIGECFVIFKQWRIGGVVVDDV
jgi:hypothetical protein